MVDQVLDFSKAINLSEPAVKKEPGPRDKPPMWYGGPYYYLCKRGGIGKSSNSGPSGRKLGGSYVQIIRALARNAPKPKKEMPIQQPQAKVK